MSPTYLFIFLSSCCFAIRLSAQTIPPSYLETAIANNLLIKEKRAYADRSVLALKSARSLSLPTTWFDAQYNFSNGGPSIDIPIGDLMNPVYQTLNQLTGSSKFPQVANESHALLPRNFYDVRIKSTMPLVNPSLSANRFIREQETSARQLELAISRREIIKEVKCSYYNYLSSQQAVAIYQSTLELVKENLRINLSLYKNGKGLPAYVTRAESELQKVQSDYQNAIIVAENAKAYFNFLLNRPLTDDILVPDTASIDLATIVEQIKYVPVTDREEIQAIRTAKEINRLSLKLDRSFRVPRINAFLDFANAYDISGERKMFFYFTGVQMQVPIFSGKRNFYKIRQTELDGVALSLQEQQLSNQLQLAVYTTANNVRAAFNNYQTAKLIQQSARQYFNLINKGYKEGINSFIELLDARNQLTQSDLQQNINYYKVLIAVAEHERQTASYSF